MIAKKNLKKKFEENVLKIFLVKFFHEIVHSTKIKIVILGLVQGKDVL
jgi:hypothetical protein